MAIEMMSISHCYCSDYMTKPTQFGDEPKKREEYREVINLLNKGYAIRDVAKLTGKGISTVQRVKKEFVA